MKKLLIITVITLFACGNKKDTPVPPDHIQVIVDKVALPEYWRTVTGYDSIQIVPTMDDTGRFSRLEVNFCYPNNWKEYLGKDKPAIGHEYWLIPKDTILIHDTIYSKVMKSYGSGDNVLGNKIVNH